MWRAAAGGSPALAVEAGIELVLREGPRACDEVLSEAEAERRRIECSGCGARYRRSALTELDEDNHDNLTYFHGDLLCNPCCDRVGVAR